MRRIVSVGVVILILLAGCGDDGPTRSDSGTVAWERAVGSPDDEWARGVAVTDDGFIVAAGSRGLFGNTDALIIMTDPAGNLMWELVEDHADPTIFYDVAVTTDNQVVAVGRQDRGESDAVMFVIKCDRDGHEVWSRAFPSEGFDEARAVLAVDDGGCIIAGTKTVFSQTGRDLFVMRLNANGQHVWRQSFTTLHHQDGFDLVEINDGSVVVAGITQLPNNTYQPMLLHVSRAGEVLGHWTIKHLVDYHPIAATCFSANQVLLSAWQDRGQQGFEGSESDEQFFLLDTDGNLLWEYTTPDNNGVNYIYDMISTPTGGAFAVGSTSSRLLNASARDIHLVHVDASRNVDATQTIGHHSFDDGYAVAAHPDGGYVIAGATRSIGNGGVDVYLVRTDEEGKMK